MTIDEWIEFAETKAKEHRERHTTCADDPEWVKYGKIWEKEYQQLAEWLRELVHLRNITEYLRDMVTCFEFMDSMHYNEDIIEWAESELSVDMREVNADDTNRCEN